MHSSGPTPSRVRVGAFFQKMANIHEYAMPPLGPRLVKTQEAHLKIRIITWLLFYACTLVAAAGAFWFVGDLNANSWIAPSIAPPAWIFEPV